MLVVTRLARRISDLIAISQSLEGKGAALQLLHQNIETETPAGRLFFAVGAIGQFETELRRERQMEGIAKAKAGGVYKGRPRQVAPSEVKALREQGLAHPRLPGSSVAVGRLCIGRWKWTPRAIASRNE